VDWSWISANAGTLGQHTAQHLYLALVPVLAGLVISLPAGIASAHWGWVYPPLLSLTTILYAVPALSLIVLILAYTGLNDTTVIIPLTIYTLAVLVPNVTDGIRSVPDPVRQAAIAMGFGPLRRLVQVELPAAVPLVIAGLRVATVSSISLVSVGQLVGIGGLGYFFVDGEQLDFPTEVWTAIGLIVILAFACDAVLVLARWALTPWMRRRVALTRWTLTPPWMRPPPTVSGRESVR
jgi:osmoprotectant transport system permease protein